LGTWVRVRPGAALGRGTTSALVCAASKERKMTVISVIVGSTRQGRFSQKPAQWILQRLKSRGGIETRLLDLREFPLPFFDQPVPPAMPGRPPYENEMVKRWTAEI